MIRKAEPADTLEVSIEEPGTEQQNVTSQGEVEVGGVMGAGEVVMGRQREDDADDDIDGQEAARTTTRKFTA